jgi:hypothetical protein
MKRLWCWLFHRKAQQQKVCRNTVSWHCGKCNVRWYGPRAALEPKP